MKAKLNFDQAKIKDFAIQHTEKVVFAVFGLVLLYFAYSGLMHETYTKVPSDLENEIRMANSHISDSTPPEKPEKGPIEIPPIEENLKPVDLNAYATRAVVRPNVRDLGTKRGNPMIVPPNDLHVSAAIGAVKLKDPPAPADPNAELIETRGIALTTITGIVQLDRQIDEFHEAFAAAIEKTGGDKEPAYIYHQVQRQELGPDGKPSPWLDINTSATKNKIAEWIADNNGQQELVAAEHIRQAICLSLPPIMGHKFGEDAAHPDLVTVKEDAAVEVEPEAANAEPAGPDRDMPAIEDPKNKNGLKKKPQEKEEKVLRKLLFRFFDFTVEPGKTYRYRGRVWVTNPNLGVEERHLAELEIVFEGKQVKANEFKYLISDWGTASPPVTIPFFSQLAAGEFLPGGARDDAMNMPVTVREPSTGFELLDILELHRGQYANIKDAEPLVVRPSAARNTAVREEDTAVVTDQFVLDFLPKDSGGVSHAVVMGPDLKLRVVHESPALVERIKTLESNEVQDTGGGDLDSDNPFKNMQLNN